MAKSKPAGKAKAAAKSKPAAAKKPAPKVAAAEPERTLPPSPCSAAELRAFKAALIQGKRRLGGDVAKLEDVGFKKSQDGGDLSSMPLHMADQGTDNFEQDITLGIMESETGEMQEIDEAIQRIKDGVFGSCEVCLKPIPKLRLKAIPHARLCIACKSKEEGV